MENELREIYVYLILGVGFLILIFLDIKIVTNWGRILKKDKDEGKCTACKFNGDINCTVGSEGKGICYEGELWEKK